MSITTAPVTIGGIAAWMIRAPNRCTANPDQEQHDSDDEHRPVTVRARPALRADHRGHANEGQRTAQ